MHFLIVEDHPMMRAGLQQLLARKFPAATLREAATAASAMESIAQRGWDLVLLDIELPDRSGLELISDILAFQPQTRILVMSAHDEREFGRRVLQAGAAGYLQKAAEPDELIYAVERILSGRKFVSAGLASILADLLQRPGALHDGLSQREFAVLRLFGRGLTPSAIAEHLNLSIKTVSTYRARIIKKLRLRTTGDIVRYAVENRLI